MARYCLFKPHFNHEQQSLPGLSPGMPWPAATYENQHNNLEGLARAFFGNNVLI